VAKVAATTYEVLKKGVYPARVKSIDEDDGQFGPQFKWIFKITAGRAKGSELFGWSSQVLSPKSKLRNWAEALLPDEDFDAKGFVLDTDDLVDCDCQIVLSVTTGNDGVERNKIESLLPVEEEEAEAADEEPAPKPARQPVAQTAKFQAEEVPFG
jgi:hypothetical protein